MTKKELITKIQEVYMALDCLLEDNSVKELPKEVKRIMELIEEIPEEADEITDEEKEKD